MTQWFRAGVHSYQKKLGSQTPKHTFRTSSHGWPNSWNLCQWRIQAASVWYEKSVKLVDEIKVSFYNYCTYGWLLLLKILKPGRILQTHCNTSCLTRAASTSSFSVAPASKDTIKEKRGAISSEPLWSSKNKVMFILKIIEWGYVIWFHWNLLVTERIW